MQQPEKSRIPRFSQDPKSSSVPERSRIRKFSQGVPYVSLSEGFEMLEKQRRAGKSPIHDRYKRMGRFEEDVIYTAADEGSEKEAREEREDFIITVSKCAISVDQAVFGLLSAGLNADGAHKTCYNMTSTDRLVCGSFVASIITNLEWMTAYLFYAPGFCGFQDIVTAWCGGDWAWFFANAGGLTAAGLASAVDCRRFNTTPVPTTPVPNSTPRRLERASKVEPQKHGVPTAWSVPEFRKQLEEDVLQLTALGRRVREEPRRLARNQSYAPLFATLCAFTVQNTVAYLADTVFKGWTAQKVCSTLGTPGNEGSEAKGLCAANILGMADFGATATSFSATLAGSCPSGGGSATAWCVADVSGMASTLTSYGAWGGTIQHDCEDGFP